jgi:type III secretion system YscI/HrpB-like protein
MTISAVALASGALTDCLEQSRSVSKTTVLPEEQLTQSIFKKQQHFTMLLESDKPITSQVSDPQTMLAIQHGMMQATLTVDLSAKIAGSLTQTVNRLATLQ